ncbi:MAG: transcription-repair coupling factor, partial [Pseudobdellovibrio sp.]
MISTYQTRLEEILLRASAKKKTVFNIIGTQSTAAVSFLLSQDFSINFNNLPSLVIVSSLEEAEIFSQQIRFFAQDYRCHILKHFDVSPYSGLYPSPSVSWDRSKFLYWAQRAGTYSKSAQKKDIFVAPIAALQQKTVPYFNFHQRGKTLKAGDILPENLNQYFHDLGYQPAPLVEDKGQYSIRGGIVDIFSVAEDKPIRLELFGDQIESLRYFSHINQLSENEVSILNLAPVYEYELTDDNLEIVVKNIRQNLKDRPVNPAEKDEMLRELTQKTLFPGSEYLLPFCYPELSSVFEHFSSELNIFVLDPIEVARKADEFYQEIKQDYNSTSNCLFKPDIESLYFSYDKVVYPKGSSLFQFSNLAFIDEEKSNEERIEYKSSALSDFVQISYNKTAGSPEWISSVKPKIDLWLKEKYKIFISFKNQTQLDRLKSLLEKLEIAFETVAGHSDQSAYSWDKWLHHLDQRQQPVVLI